jgi:hypothetical protein
MRGGSATLPGLIASTGSGLVASTGLFVSTGISIGIGAAHRANATSCRREDQMTMAVEDIHLTGLWLGRRPSGLTALSTGNPKTSVTAAEFRPGTAEESEQLNSPDGRVAHILEG